MDKFHDEGGVMRRAVHLNLKRKILLPFKCVMCSMCYKGRLKMQSS